MHTKIEKINLLSQMISFAIIDGKLHKKEMQFLKIVAQELQIEENEFKQLFDQEHKIEVIKDNFERIEQFYRLALLMHCDGVLHDREQIKIREIGIAMGLNPFAMKRVLKAMEQSKTRMISPDYLLKLFQEQLN